DPRISRAGPCADVQEGNNIESAEDLADERGVVVDREAPTEPAGTGLHRSSVARAGGLHGAAAKRTAVDRGALERRTSDRAAPGDEAELVDVDALGGPGEVVRLDPAIGAGVAEGEVGLHRQGVGERRPSDELPRIEVRDDLVP